MERIAKVILVSTFFALVSCGGGISKSPKKAVGGQGQPCNSDGTCAPMLACIDDICELPSDNNDNVQPNNMNVRPNNDNVDPNNFNVNVMTGFCGDGVADSGESCDRTDLRGETCVSFGFDDGVLACSGTCQFDDSNCFNDTSSVCGNFIIEDGEACDGGDLDGQTCQSLGYSGGQLRCGPDCLDYDVEGCFNTACGNGVVEQGEFCDRDALGGQTCMGLGYDGGELRCNSACANYDVSRCTECGDGVKEGTEECDGDDFGGETCLSLGLDAGELACSNACEVSILGCGDAPPLMCGLPSGCSVNDVNSCMCQGCVNDGVCNGSDDCVCPDCDNSANCPDNVCIVDGICDPYNENCRCIDCAAHPECAP